tara:strand:- start:434 stop:2761 length:2328 start_codon:yes stop_codon:yes gene_type:complete
MIKNKTILKITIYIFFAIIIFQNPSFTKDVYEITAKKVTYNESKNIVIADGDALAINSLGKKVSSDKMVYYKNKNLIETFGSSQFEDGKIILTANNFKYDIDIKTIEAIKNVVLLDQEKNKFLFSFFKYFENEEKGFGDNMKAYLKDGSYLDSETGQTNNKTEITKLNQAKYTTCSNIVNKKNKFCPTWSMKSSSTTHDKKKKKIIHKNAFLRIKNIPILYSPYFSHPDPSVKRKSGFLPPSIKTISELGRTFRTPYFWVISEDKDLTLTPIYYFDEKHSLLGSYRQAFKKGFLEVETGYSGGYKRLEKTGRTKGSRNYLFADYNGTKDNFLFGSNDIKIKIQRVSQTNFLRSNKINTPLFNEDIRNLENTIYLSTFDNKKRLSVRAGIFENLGVNDSSKYTYFLPDGVFSYNANRLKNFNVNFNSYFQGQKFSKNQKQFKIRNLIYADSKQIVNKQIGTGTVLKTNFYNKNIYNRNVSGQKENDNIDNYFTFALDNSLPLGKFSKKSYQTLTPKIYAKYTSGSQLNAFNNSKILNYSDIFSLNRTNDLDLPETGFSIGHGIDYGLKRKKDDKTVLFSTNAGIGQVLRTSRQDNMPNRSSLNNKSSDFAGFLNFELFGDENEFKTNNSDKISFIGAFKRNKLSFNYDYILSNDLRDLNRNSFNVSGTYKKLFSSIAFEEQNKYIGDVTSLTYSVKKLFHDNYHLSYNGKRNLQTNSTEYHNISLSFENDCLTSALAYTRDFYSDQDIKPSKTLIFSIIIKPFSDTFAPDLTNLLN